MVYYTHIKNLIAVMIRVTEAVALFFIKKGENNGKDDKKPWSG